MPHPARRRASIDPTSHRSSEPLDGDRVPRDDPGSTPTRMLEAAPPRPVSCHTVAEKNIWLELARAAAKEWPRPFRRAPERPRDRPRPAL